MPEETRPATARRIAIVGGGIAGLSAAYELEKLAAKDGSRLRIDLYEAADRLGGAIRTVRDGPFLIDAGPDSLITTKPWAIELVRELGLESELIPTDEKNRGVALFSRGRLRPLMFGAGAPAWKLMLGFATSGALSWPGLVRLCADLVLPRGGPRRDQTMADFFTPRLGAEAVERLVDPLMAGIYGGDPHRLSLSATFPRFVELQRRHRSVLVAMLARRAEERRAGPLFKTLRQGLGRLVETLASRLRMTTPSLATAARAVRRDGAGYELETSAGPQGDYSSVILAVPAHVAARLVRGLAPELSARLGAIRYTSTATIFLAFRRGDLAQPPPGYGFLVPLCEGRRINGATWVSNKYPGRAPADAFLVRCFVGGDRTPAELELDDEALARVCLRELRVIAGLGGDPIMERVFRWERSNPQYEVGHARRVREIEDLTARHPGLWLTGSAYRGVGVPDCVRDGRDVARRVFELAGQLADV